MNKEYVGVKQLKKVYVSVWCWRSECLLDIFNIKWLSRLHGLNKNNSMNGKMNTLVQQLNKTDEYKIM